MLPIVSSVLLACKTLIEKLSLAYQCSRLRTAFRTFVKVPETLRTLPVTLWGGEAQRGYALLNGFFQISDEQGTDFQRSWTTPEELFAAPPYLASYLYRFELLRDLKVTGDISARRLARRLIEFFFQHEPSSRRCPPFVTATRLSNLILLYDFFGASADATFRRTFFRGLRRDYLALRRRFPAEIRDENVEARLGVTKALVEYTVYVEEDAPFLAQVLRKLPDAIQSLEDSVVRTSVTSLFRSFCGLIDLRNTLLQNEKTFLNRHPYYRRTYQKALRSTQTCLQRLVPFLRFHRHSNGTLCRLGEGSKAFASELFFAPVPTALIDMALSQVDVNPDLPPLERTDILRQASKRAVLFAGLTPQAPTNRYRIDGYRPNILPNVMNIEWSAHSYSVVQDSSVAFLPKETEGRNVPDLDGKADFRYRRTPDGFEGLCLSPTYAFKRRIRLLTKEDRLSGEDELLIHEFDEALALESFTFGMEWSLDRVLHEPPATHGEALFHLSPLAGAPHKAKKGSRTNVACHLVLNADIPFSLKVSPVRQATRMAMVFLLESGCVRRIRWSIQIVKE